jgi:beta-mannosidase
MFIELQLLDPNGKQLEKSTVLGPEKHKFFVKTPDLWYPVGYGSQPQLHGDADQISRRVGIRLSELVQRPDPWQGRNTFFFRINNMSIFCRVTNWIPPDTFLPRMKFRRYRPWLELALKGNQNMIRVWSGGLYEDDASTPSATNLASSSGKTSC